MGDQWDGREMQEEYLARIGRGDRESEGASREWVQEGRIEFCEGRTGEVISSTRVREACERGDGEELKRLVTEEVAEFVLAEGLYKDS